MKINLQYVQEWMIDTVKSEKLVVGYKIYSSFCSKPPKKIMKMTLIQDQREITGR